MEWPNRVRVRVMDKVKVRVLSATQHPHAYPLYVPQIHIPWPVAERYNTKCS